MNSALSVNKVALRLCEKRLKQFLLFMILGVMIAAACEYIEDSKEELSDGRIKRDGYNGNDKIVHLWVRNELTGEKEKIDVNVDRQEYSTEELDEMLYEAEPIIRKTILGKNKTSKQVLYDLNFVNSLDEYPFEISYRSNYPLIVNNRGIIQQERLSEQSGSEYGISIVITIIMRYENYVREISQEIVVFPFSERFSLIENAEKEIAIKEENTRTEEYLNLPNVIEETPILYEEVKSYKSVFIFLLALIVSLVMYRKEDRNITDSLKKRDESSMETYSRIVNKIYLLYSVGVPTKGIIVRLCSEYRENMKSAGGKIYAYEELLKVEQRINEGVSELKAYEEYGLRVGLPQYMRLVNLLQQMVMKGRNDMEILLEEELEKAFADRKNRARKLGEEAGTKLLLPMFLMFAVVLIIVMVPAFVSFRM